MTFLNQNRRFGIDKSNSSQHEQEHGQWKQASRPDLKNSGPLILHHTLKEEKDAVTCVMICFTAFAI